jgi:hypothetical protein
MKVSHRLDIGYLLILVTPVLAEIFTPILALEP